VHRFHPCLPLTRRRAGNSEGHPNSPATLVEARAVEASTRYPRTKEGRHGHSLDPCDAESGLDTETAALIFVLQAKPLVAHWPLKMKWVVPLGSLHRDG